MCDGKFCKDCDCYGGVDGSGWCSHWQNVRCDYNTCEHYRESRSRIGNRFRRICIKMVKPRL